jgi:hypothetical protein
MRDQIDGRGTMAAKDEELEIVFWWMGGDSEQRIEDELEDFLTDTRPTGRRRRLPWRPRRTRSA